jgi:hypothetical protein
MHKIAAGPHPCELMHSGRIARTMWRAHRPNDEAMWSALTIGPLSGGD